MNKIKIPHNKNTNMSETVKIPVPKRVKIPMCQHLGVNCEPVVKVGDRVLVGQIIGQSEAFMSTPLHSSVSGEVKEIVEYLPSNGRVCKAVVIESDGLQEVCCDVKPPEVCDRESFIKAIRESGLCGMGGAGFPTHIKLAFDQKQTPIHSLIVNGAECEPYITSDYRELVENSSDVMEGIKAVMGYLEIGKAYICIENNKPEAIKLFEEKCKNEENISVVKLKSNYPQGAEKVVVYSSIGKIIGEGDLPSSVGAMVINCTTIGFISRYLKTGMPLVERRVTVDGDAVKTPCNVRVCLGTSISEILEFADTKLEIIEKALLGGPMMGACIYDLQTPICKTNNAVLAFKKSENKAEQTNCIRCGRCVRACPLNLMPSMMEKAYDRGDAEALKDLKVNLCMNCGSCSYVCPAKRNLAEKNQLAKALLPKK